MAVAVAPDGSVFISDFSNQRLRQIDASGAMTTFAQRRTSKLVIDSNGVVFAVADDAVDRYRPDGHRSALIGERAPHGFSGDGELALTASMNAGGLAQGSPLTGRKSPSAMAGTIASGDSVRAVLAPPGTTIQIAGSSSQVAALGHEFSLPMRVAVRGEDGLPEPSVRIEFHSPESGPSCLFPDGMRAAAVLTDRAGTAQIRCRAWGSVGSYAVSATTTGSERSVAFSMTNSPAPPRRRAARH
jgi:hypothetical protein